MRNYLPSPKMMGIGEKFKEWRPYQEDAVIRMADLEQRFGVMIQPTGSGKSLCYIVAAHLSGARTVVLTSTKALQSQLAEDFDVAVIKGQNAYRCKLDEALSCEAGPCKLGIRCGYKEGGCLYYDAYRDAKNARLVVTNYSYWLTINFYGEGLGEFDMMVLDEAHDAPDHLNDFMGVKLTWADFRSLKSRPPRTDSLVEWRAWARPLRSWIQERMDEIKVKIGSVPDSRSTVMKEGMTLKKLDTKLARIAETDDRWIAEEEDGGWTVDPIDSRRYNEMLFRGIEKVILTSATVTGKTAEMLGVERYDIADYPSTFPPPNRPVIYVPTVAVNYRWKEVHKGTWITRMRQIIRPRMDRKGIIHTVSYARRNLVIERLGEEFSFLTSHDSKNVKSAVENFRYSHPPAVLVSPSLVTGWDFPYDDCEYQIIGKIGFPDTRPAIVKARQEADPEYVYYRGMQSLVQACGRGVRAPDDQCECFIIDDSFRWFMQRYGKFAPGWFKDVVRWSNTIPLPMKKIGG